LIQRVGLVPVMLAGVVSEPLAAFGIALSGIDVPHFLGALVLLGVGWNFLYIGGTTLALRGRQRRAIARVLRGSTIFRSSSIMVLSSFSSGVIVGGDGWRMLNHRGDSVRGVGRGAVRVARRATAFSGRVSLLAGAFVGGIQAATAAGQPTPSRHGVGKVEPRAAVVAHVTRDTPERRVRGPERRARET
jgi:hypothetical protein